LLSIKLLNPACVYPFSESESSIAEQVAEAFPFGVPEGFQLQFVPASQGVEPRE